MRLIVVEKCCGEIKLRSFRQFIAVSFLVLGMGKVAVADVARTKSSKKAKKLDVRFQLRSYFSAGGASTGLGGNFAGKTMPIRHKGKTKAGAGIRIVVSLPDPALRWSGFQGKTIQVINTSGKAVVFDAQDSLLDIVHEALDSSGVWRQIEYMPRSWCGNSYHTLSLPAKSKWSLVAPVYTGDTPVKMRVRIVTPKGIVSSKVFHGSINAEQFDASKKQGHQANNIMDPNSN